MKNLMIAVLFLGLSGCAGAALEDEMKERGYSEQDMEAIQKGADKYKTYLIGARMNSNRFNTAPQQAAETNLTKIWCGCQKKLGQACRGPSRGIASSDKPLWVGANAVEMAFASMETSFDSIKSSDQLDPLMCQ